MWGGLGVPYSEPSILAIFVIGLAGLGFMSCRRRRKVED